MRRSLRATALSAAVMLAMLDAAAAAAGPGPQAAVAARPAMVECAGVPKRAPARCGLTATNRYWPASAPLRLQLAGARWSAWTARAATGEAWSGRVHARLELSRPRDACGDGVRLFTHLRLRQLNLSGATTQTYRLLPRC